MKNRNIYRCIRTAFSTTKCHFVLMMVLGVLNCLANVLSVYSINKFFAEVEIALSAGAVSAVSFKYMVIYAVVLLCNAMYTVYYKRYFVQFKSVTCFEKKIRTNLHEKCSRISNEQFEIPDVDLKLKQARSASVNVYRLAEVVVTIAIVIVSAISLGGYVFSFNAWYVLFFALSILPAVITVAYKTKLWKKFYKQMGQLKREEEVYSSAICGLNSACENKLNDANKILLTKWSQTRSQADSLENFQSVKIFLLKILLSFATIIGEYGGFVLSLVLFYGNSIDFGEFSATIAAYALLKDMFKSLFELFGHLGFYGMMVGPYFDFMDLPERKLLSDCKYSFKDGLRLINVSFAYPNSDRLAIDNISLSIKKGEHISIVGENGAGKTTLLKIILGLYVASSGSVQYDGQEIGNFAEKDLYCDKSAVQQKFNRYGGFTLAENIYLGVNGVRDIDSVKEKLGIPYIENNLCLGREFGGKELSGGEWQRVACVRGFIRQFDLVALDEPTSAIDPINEKNLYDAFDVYGEGKTVIIITHRLGAVRLSDKIVVLKNGKIEAVGDHLTLLNTCEYYKKMWETQSEKYRCC